MGAVTGELLEWAWAGAALDGVASGDLHVVADYEGGVLLGVIDGLGHGAPAGEAASLAARVLADHAGEELDALVARCHEALRGTRGAVMSLAALDARAARMTWAGIGNVEAFLVRGDPRTPGDSIRLRGGIVGYHLPSLHAATVPVSPGDVVVMGTDGLRGDFRERVTRHGTPAEIADAILAGHARGTDDALVLVARVLAPGGAQGAPARGGLP